MKKFFATALAASMLAAVPAAVVSADNNQQSDATVYDVAKNASKGRWIVDRNGDDFDILVFAVKVTGLKGALDDPNADLTVFAPDDKTFKATFGGRSEFGTLLRVLRAVNYDRNALKDILLYHVTGLNTDDDKGLSFAEVAGALEAGNGTVEVPMLNGGTTTVSSDLTIDGGSSDPSPIVATDLFGSNGVIHVIGGSVLLP